MLPCACPSCGAPCPRDFAFCPRCGTKLPAAPAESGGAAEGDRRPVTVVFADLAGFTALSERLDPEDVRALQRELFQLMAAAVDRYEGFVEKFVGDAIMAVFGAPVAHEDDPERALHAALAMQGRMAELNRRWERRAGGPLALHVGVNTGPVVAGALGARSDAAYAVTGDTVNTAARLQAAAGAGQIMVSAATARVTGHAFAFAPLGELTLKGKREPVPVHRLVGALRSPRPARGLETHGLVTPLVGRAGELRLMLDAFDRMRAARAQVVSVIGEAGAGKSRLLHEFFARVDEAGHLATTAVRRAECSALNQQTYGVIGALLREAYALAPGDSPDAVREKLGTGMRALGAGEDEVEVVVALVGYLLGLEPDDARLRNLEPEQVERQIFLAARRLVERRLQHGPLILVVEDLHWADRASIELLRLLVDRLEDRSLMLLLAYRPAPEAAAFAPSRAAHTAIRLAPLTPGDSQALLDRLFGPSAARLPAAVRELVVARAGGNPLYLEEVIRNLIDAGVLRRTETGWECAGDPTALDVPQTIHALLLSRLDRLPPDARRLVQEAAVLGPVFDETLLRMIGSAPESCAATLAVLRDAGFVEAMPGADPRHRFTHAFLQEVVYQNLLMRRRAELHGRAGEALERLCGAHPPRLEDLEALGHHFRLSPEKRRAAPYLVAAGDRARAVYANDDALRHYQRAFETLVECEAGEADLAAVRERLADLLAPAGHRQAALAHYEAVRAAAEAAGDLPAQARVQRKIGGLHWNGGDRPRALACFQAGLALLEGRLEHVELAHLYQEMGRLAFRSGDNARAREWAERAASGGERLYATAGGEEARRDAAAAMAQAYNTLGIALARMGGLEEAVGHIERSVSVALAHGLLHAACRGYTNLGVLYSTSEPARAIDTCVKGLDTAKKIGDLGLQSSLYANLAVAYCALTDRCEEQGVSAARAAVDLDRQLGQVDHLAVPLIVLAQIYQCHGGDPERALACYREALELAEEMGEPQLLFPCYDGLATLYLDLGDEARAEEYMQKAQQVCEDAGLEPDSLVVLPFLG